MNKITRPTSSAHLNSEHETERLNQINYARQKLTLSSSSKTNSEKNTMNKQSQQVQQIQKQKTIKQRVQKVGHESCLSKVIAERRKIGITFINGDYEECEPLEFDKFTIRVRKANGTCMWIFKGATIGFVEIEQLANNS